MHIQYSSHLSWHSHVLNTHVFFNFCQVASDSVVKTCVWHAIGCTQVDCYVLHFMHCTIVRSTQVILCVLYVSSSSLLVCCTQVNCLPFQKKNQGLQWNGTLAKHDKMHGHKIIAFCQVFTYSYSIPLWMTLYWTKWMSSMIIVQG